LLFSACAIEDPSLAMDFLGDQRGRAPLTAPRHTAGQGMQWRHVLDARSGLDLIEGDTWGCRIGKCRPQPKFAELFVGQRLLARSPLFLGGHFTTQAGYTTLFRFLVSGVPAQTDRFGPPGGAVLRVVLSDGQRWTVRAASGSRDSISVAPLWD